MPDPALRLILAGILIAAAAAKLGRPVASRRALADTFGLRAAGAATVAWTLLIATEAGLGIAVAAGSDAAAYGAALLMGLFAALLVGAILRGHAGAPCGCFGVRSTVGWAGVARNLALAGAFAALPALRDLDLATDTWLGIARA